MERLTRGCKKPKLLRKLVLLWNSRITIHAQRDMVSVLAPANLIHDSFKKSSGTYLSWLQYHFCSTRVFDFRKKNEGACCYLHAMVFPLLKPVKTCDVYAHYLVQAQ